VHVHVAGFMHCSVLSSCKPSWHTYMPACLTCVPLWHHKQAQHMPCRSATGDLIACCHLFRWAHTLCIHKGFVSVLLCNVGVGFAGVLLRWHVVSCTALGSPWDGDSSRGVASVSEAVNVGSGVVYMCYITVGAVQLLHHSGHVLQSRKARLCPRELIGSIK
jgi:hypothetical protein